MSSCQSPTCQNGNCEGCKNGKTWCNDPRCFPYCRDCQLPKNHETNANIVVWLLFSLLGAIFIILLVGYGPRFVEARRRNQIVDHRNNWADQSLIIE